MLFDLNGTLLDPRTMARPLGDDDQSRQLVLDALDDAVAQAIADTLAGGYRPLLQYLRASLERRLRLAGRPPDTAVDAVELADRLEPFPDAVQSLAQLRTAGHRVAVVTNSATDSGRSALEHAGLAEYVEFVVGADQVEAYKPDRRVYVRALDAARTAAGDAWLVAAHWWDVLGAKRAGMHTAWLGHRERLLYSTVPEPDIVAESLADVAARLSAR